MISYLDNAVAFCTSIQLLGMRQLVATSAHVFFTCKQSTILDDQCCSPVLDSTPEQSTPAERETVKLDLHKLNLT